MASLQRRILVAAALVAVSAPLGADGQVAPAQANAVSVTVKYNGKGMVDSDHKLWVWLFDTPEIGVGSIPIAEESMAKNGGTVTFPSVAAGQVYIAVAYDEKGGFIGQAPPPPGSPIGLYGAAGPDDKPTPVAPGAKASVKIVLTDAQRMQ